MVLDRYKKGVYAGSMATDTVAETGAKASQTQTGAGEKQTEAPGHKIAKLLLKGATKEELLKEGFKVGTINDWLAKLKKKGKTGILRLLQEEGIDVSDVPAPASAPAPRGTGA